MLVPAGDLLEEGGQNPPAESRKDDEPADGADDFRHRERDAGFHLAHRLRGDHREQKGFQHEERKPMAVRRSTRMPARIVDGVITPRSSASVTRPV